MKLQARTDHVRKVRNDGFVPGVIYGKKIDSTPIQADGLELRKMYNENGKSKVFDVELGSKKHKVYIKDIQRFPMNPSQIMHFDLQRVTSKDTIHAKVPVTLIGKEAVEKRKLLVVLALHEIPCEFGVGHELTELELNVTEMDIDQAIYIKDLQVPKGVKIDADPEEMVLVIREGKMKEEVVEETTTEPAEAPLVKDEEAEK